MEQDINNVKKLITGILVSSPLRLTIGHIDKDYSELVGHHIPYRQLGFTSLEGCLSSMKDILEVVGSGSRAEVLVRISSKSSHIQHMVEKQRISQPRKRNKNNYRRIQPPRFNKPFKPVPLMSINCSTPIKTTPTYKLPTLPNNNMSSIKPSTVHNSVSSELHENLPKQEIPSTSSCNGTIPRQVVTYREKYSDSSDTEDIYESDTDDENNYSYVNTSKNISCDTKEINDGLQETEQSISYSTHNSSNNVPSSVQNNLKKLISQYDDGIWCGALPEIYNKLFRKELCYSEYGYRSLISMCMDLYEIFHCIRPDTGDFKLYDKQKELPKDYNHSIKISQLFKYFKDYSDAPSIEPAIIETEDQLLHSFEYPENVLELYEEIPRLFIPENISQNDYIDVCVGEVYDPSKFWILLNEYTNDLENLMDELQSFYTSIDIDYTIPGHMVKEGLYCVAQYSNEYHRAVIVNTIKSIKNKVKVYYLDYGTVSAVEPSTLKFLHRKFSDLPQQAIRARLASIYPPTEKTQWTCEAASRFLQLVTMKVLVAQIHHIDTERQIVEVFLADTSGKDDIFMNDKLVDEGFALFTNQVQTKTKLEPHETPWVKYIHLFPTFIEIERSAVPSASEMIRLQKVGIPLDQIYPRYFIQEDIHDIESINHELCKSEKKCEQDHKNNINSSDVTNSDDERNNTINEHISDSSAKECSPSNLICTKPPPGYENVIPFVKPNRAETSQANNCFQPITVEQQQHFQNYEVPFPPVYNYNQPTYHKNFANPYQENPTNLIDIMYKFLITYPYAQATLMEFLIVQRQWLYSCSPQRLGYFANIFSTMGSLLTHAQKQLIIQEMLTLLTYGQLILLLNLLSHIPVSQPTFENSYLNRVSNSFHHMELNQTDDIFDINSSESSTNNSNLQTDHLQNNQRMIVETGL